MNTLHAHTIYTTKWRRIVHKYASWDTPEVNFLFFFNQGLFIEKARKSYVTCIRTLETKRGRTTKKNLQNRIFNIKEIQYKYAVKKKVTNIYIF